MKSRVSVLFYPKNSNINTKGEVPVYLRITVNGKRFEVFADRMVHPDQWITGWCTFIMRVAYIYPLHRYFFY